MRCLLLVCAGLVLGASPSWAKETVRDVRTTSNSSWDYQPGQGPQYVRDKDYFDPFKTNDEKILPPKPVQKDDWREPPAAEERLPIQESSSAPHTESAGSVGLQVSSYHYHESSLGVKLQGPHYGLIFEGTGAFADNWFVRANGSLNVGNFDYKGSGMSDNNANFVADMQGSVGYDLLAGRFGLSPYVGIGYRFLNSDIRGTTSTGASGYRRDSHYLYVPAGVQLRMRVYHDALLTWKGEYDHLIYGKQISNLSDVVGYPDIKNDQKRGFGLRSELMYETDRWAFGPYGRYWNINQSTTNCGTGTIYYVCGYEPHNHTLEYGFQFLYRFY